MVHGFVIWEDVCNIYENRGLSSNYMDITNILEYTAWW